MIWGTKDNNLKLIVCSPDKDDQKKMASFLRSTRGLDFITNQLRILIHDYLSKDFDYVIFDTPAELKELSLCAASHTLKNRGKNLFITTLHQPPFDPLLNCMEERFSKGENFLIVNKVRELDRSYCSDKTALIDFITNGYKFDFDRKDPISNAFIDKILNLVGVRPVRWSEMLYRMLTLEHSLKETEEHNNSVIDDHLKEDLKPIVDWIIKN